MQQEFNKFALVVPVFFGLLSIGCENSVPNNASTPDARPDDVSTIDLTTTNPQLDSSPGGSVLDKTTPPEGLGIDPEQWSQYEPAGRKWLLAPALRDRGAAIFKLLGLSDARPGYDLENHDVMTVFYATTPLNATLFETFTDDAFDELVKHKDSLHRLEIDNMVVTEAIAQRIPELDNLDILILHSGNVSSSVLAMLPELSKLEECTLINIQLNDDLLASALFPPSLRLLDVRTNEGITDASVSALSKLTHLEQLILTGTSITEEGKQALQKAMPDCIIPGGPKPRKI